MKLVVSSSALALVLAIPALASAQTAPSSSCPPGSWFCAPPPEAQPAPAGKAVQGLQPLPEDEDGTPPPPPPPPRHPGVTYEPAPSKAPPPVVVYQPPAPVVVVRPEEPPPYEYAPPPRHNGMPPHEWGLNLHLEGATMGSGARNNAGMGGLGAGLRFRPIRYFALESNLDFVGGHGYSGDVRNETALTFNALVFLNPKDRFQVYLLGGIGWSWAHSRNDPGDTSSFDNYYHYFGGQAGIGLEMRVTKVLAFNVDFRGFVRSRTDELAQSQPEFTNAQGQSTNTSGGGLLTGGMTLYF